MGELTGLSQYHYRTLRASYYGAEWREEVEQWPCGCVRVGKKWDLTRCVLLPHDVVRAEREGECGVVW